MGDPPVDHIPARNWSGQLKVASPEKTKHCNLPADKVILPDSLLRNILDAASVSEFDAPATSSDQSPLMFRLSTELGNMVYGGVRDFSGTDGEIVLSPYLLEALGLVRTHAGDNAGSKRDEPAEPYSPASLSVQLRQPPKGTFARLRPLAAGYNPGDWKPLLERELKTYTTLTKGATVSVPGTRGEVFRFLVDDLEPEGYAVCLIDVDLAIDIVPLDENQAWETRRQAAEQASDHGESSVGGLIEMGKSVLGQVVKGGYVTYELTSWIKSEPITISLECEADGHDIDLFASPKSDSLRELPDFQTHVFADMSSRNSKTITITPSNIAFRDAESIRIAIGGYVPEDEIDRGEDIRRYTIQVLPTSAFTAPSDVEEHSEHDRRCDNCKRWISPTAWVNHSIFCVRNNVACPQCFKVWKKNDPDRHAHWHCDQHGESGDTDWSQAKHTRLFHDEEYSCHDPMCSAVGKKITLPELAKHRTTDCAGKLHLCQFCHLELPQGQPTFESDLQGLTAHELTEGNKTQHCDICGKLVLLRMIRAHVRNHDIERDARPRPQICRTALCGRTIHGASQDGSINASTRMGQGPGNEIGLCSLCFAKLYAAIHDPENKALRSRIERRYLQQLTKGCGKTWCRNEWCKTGCQNYTIIPKANNLTEAMKVTKPLVISALDKQAQAHFCVDQTSQAQKLLAKRMAEQNIWELEWTVAACEAEKGDETKAWNWLQRYAPTRQATPAA